MNHYLVYKMTRIMEILVKIIEQIEKNNPYGLIFKGGTALSIIYLNHHRESEDLDFDADIKYLKDYKIIQKYIITLLENLKNQNIVKDYKLGKTGLASTNRYHMKIQFISYRMFQTKIDIDFVVPRGKINHHGELLFYTLERMFISKIITFTERGEFKDFIDIAYMIPKIDFNVYENKNKLAELLTKLINTVDEKLLIERYNNISRNVDLKIKDLRKGEIKNLINRTFRAIRKAINILKS